MTLLEIKHLLQKYRISPNKFMGQNFTVDASVYKRLIRYAFINENDEVLDVGAGLGFLTQALAEKCKKVFAVESDGQIFEVLTKRLSGLSNAFLIRGNILKIDVPHVDKVVSIPPYGISSKLLIWLLKGNFGCSVIVFQKEFAERLLAEPRSRDYSWLSVVAYYYAEIELLDAIPSDSFYPEPKVDSIIVRLKPKLKKPFPLKDENCFECLTRALFTNRNRKVRNAVLVFLKKKRQNDLKRGEKGFSGPFTDRRVRELTPEDFGALANAIC